MKISANRTIFIFFILVFVDIPIGRFSDVLPDALGYLGLFVGFSMMMDHHKRFGRAQVIALCLFLLELVFLFNMVTDTPYVLFLTFIEYLIDLFMVYFMFTAYSQLLSVFDHRELIPMTDFAFYAYVFSTLLKSLSYVLPSLSVMFTFIVYLIYAFTLYVIWRCYQTIRTRLDDFDFDVEQVPSELSPGGGSDSSDSGF